MLVALTMAPFHRVPSVHPQAKFVMVKWLGTESFVPISLEDVPTGGHLAKRAHEELKMYERARFYAADIVLYKIVPKSAKKPADHATTLEEVSATYERVDEGALGDVHGSWLLATPPFVAAAGEGIAE